MKSLSMIILTLFIMSCDGDNKATDIKSLDLPRTVKVSNTASYKVDGKFLKVSKTPYAKVTETVNDFKLDCKIQEFGPSTVEFRQENGKTFSRSNVGGKEWHVLTTPAGSNDSSFGFAGRYEYVHPPLSTGPYKMTIKDIATYEKNVAKFELECLFEEK